MGAVNPASDWATDDEVASVAHRLDHRVRVLPEPGGVVVAGQVDGDDIVAERPKPRSDAVPVPGVGAGAVDQYVGSHQE